MTAAVPPCAARCPLVDTLNARIARDEGKTEQTIRLEVGMPATSHTAAPSAPVPHLPRVYGGGDLLRAVLAALPASDPHGFLAAAAHAQDEADRDLDDAVGYPTTHRLEVTR